MILPPVLIPPLTEGVLREGIAAYERMIEAHQRELRRLHAMLLGPIVMVEAHWMHYGGHDTKPFLTVEEAAAFLTQMYEDGNGAPLGVTLGGVPIPWAAYGGTDVHEPDPSNWNFQRDTS